MFCRICIALYKLASCCEYKAVASLFGIGKTSVQRYVQQFLKALCRRKKDFIKWYQPDEILSIIETFESKYKYPMAIGAIDGSHIPINPPLDGKADYLCRKGYPSVILQGVVDCKFKFRDIYANTAGAAHDATVFYRSPLSRLIHTNMPALSRTIGEVEVPVHLLGDPAYPLSDKIVKGYVGNNLTPEEESFNVYHSSARMCVEIAFGRLKSRWRILQKKIDMQTTCTPRIITACCILHNICEDWKAPMPVPVDDAILYPQPSLEYYDRVDAAEASDIRNAIKTHLASTQPLKRSFHR